jgi:hypothetical protein
MKEIVSAAKAVSSWESFVTFVMNLADSLKPWLPGSKTWMATIKT